MKVAAGEAVAYLRSGILASRGVAIAVNPTSVADVGVLFVHGVGASAAQFDAFQRALAPHAGWFDGYEYRSWRHPRELARQLAAHIAALRPRSEKLVVIGHSLGGLLLRMILQGPDPLPHVAGFISVCAPLGGTRISRFALRPSLRALDPDGELIAEVRDGSRRLADLGAEILAIGAKRDQFIHPAESALLSDHPQLVLETGGHVASLFDPGVHAAAIALIERVRAR